jgi:DNA-binding LytR/AlgR family response regulator
MHDSVSDAPDGRLVTAAEEDAAEQRRLSGMMTGAVISGAGAVLFLAGGAALRSFMAQASVPPWVAASAWTVAAVVAVAGMVIVARRQARPVARLRAQLFEVNEASVAAVEQPPPLSRFQVDTRKGRRIVAAADVEWLEANGNYARLHTAVEAFLYRMPLSRLEQQLDPRQFVRVHRSAIVNVDRVRHIEPFPSGDAVLHLESGASVRMSRRFARSFHEMTGREATRSAPSSSGD